MTKVIILDFWGTIIEQGVRSPLKQVQQILRIDMPFSEFVVRFEQVFFTEVFPDLRSGFEAVLREFGVKAPPFVIEKLIGMWNKNRLLAQPFPDTISTLEDLSKDYKLVILSNTDGFSVPSVLEKFHIEKHFSYVYLSFKEGMLKMDPESFRKIFTELSVTAEDCVMIGDSLESDMKGAELAGVRGILLDRRGTRDYPEKISSLSEIRAKLG